MHEKVYKGIWIHGRVGMGWMMKYSVSKEINCIASEGLWRHWNMKGSFEQGKYPGKPGIFWYESYQISEWKPEFPWAKNFWCLNEVSMLKNVELKCQKTE